MIDGEPRIADGLYDRAKLYTILVALFFDWVGESLVVARMPSVIAGSLLVVAVFLWTRAAAGNLAAWIAALFVPRPIFRSRSSPASMPRRAWCSGWLRSVFTTSGPDVSTFGAIACGLGFLFALRLQILPAIGLVGLLLWLAVAVGLPALLSLRARPLAFWGAITTLSLLGAAVLAAAFFSGVLGGLIEQYRNTPLHALPVRNQV